MRDHSAERSCLNQNGKKLSSKPCDWMGSGWTGLGRRRPATRQSWPLVRPRCGLGTTSPNSCTDDRSLRSWPVATCSSYVEPSSHAHIRLAKTLLHLDRPESTECMFGTSHRCTLSEKPGGFLPGRGKPVNTYTAWQTQRHKVESPARHLQESRLALSRQGFCLELEAPGRGHLHGDGGGEQSMDSGGFQAELLPSPHPTGGPSSPLHPDKLPRVAMSEQALRGRSLDSRIAHVALATFYPW